MTEKKDSKQPEEKKVSSDVKYGIILVRGLAGINIKVKDTLKMLNLQKKHACVIIPANKNYDGMLKRAKDYITWGEIDSETEKLLVEKRGQKDSEGKLKKYFNLHPPIGGYERAGIKKGFNQGGVLGYRKDKINDLIKKMI